jgi:type II secretory pathway predicted ATPase ExeA
MYDEHFRLSGEPFSLTPDPAFLFLSEKHREAMAAVQYGLENGRGFITLIGEVGTGKTTILYSVLSQLGPEVSAAYVAYAAHTFDDLLTVALKDFGERPPAGASRLELLEILQQMLFRRDEAGQRTALVIDEAQSLSDSTFEELRLLSNFETYTHKLLQIVLVGQPELQTRLRQQNLRQLQQRVSVRAIINPLDAGEMEGYIYHRLRQVGGDGRLFEPAAMRAIVRHARGIPRRANILGHSALLFAFGRSQPVVTLSTAREAIAEMDERAPGWMGRSSLQRVSMRPSWSSLRPRALVEAAAALGRRAVERVSSAQADVASLPPFGLVLAAAAALIAVGALLIAAGGSRSAGAPKMATAAATAAPVPVRAPTPAADAPSESAQPAAPVAAGAADPPLAPEAAPAVAPAQIAAHVEVAAKEAEARPAPAPAGGPADLGTVHTVNIPRGGSILAAARELYGDRAGDFDRSALLEQVRRLNPGLRDVNLVKAGAVVKFPSTPGRSENDGQHPE